MFFWDPGGLVSLQCAVCTVGLQKHIERLYDQGATEWVELFGCPGLGVGSHANVCQVHSAVVESTGDDTHHCDVRGGDADWLANSPAIRHLCYRYGDDRDCRCIDVEEGGLAWPVQGAAEGSRSNSAHDECEECVGELSDERRCNPASG